MRLRVAEAWPPLWNVSTYGIRARDGREHCQRRHERVVALAMNEVPITAGDQRIEARRQVPVALAGPGLHTPGRHAVEAARCVDKLAAPVGRQDRHVESGRGHARRHLLDVRLDPAHHRIGVGRHHRDARGTSNRAAHDPLAHRRVPVGNVLCVIHVGCRQSILAGGLGNEASAGLSRTVQSRWRPSTAGRSWNTSSPRLRANGFDEVVICVGFMSEVVRGPLSATARRTAWTSRTRSSRRRWEQPAR